MCLITLQKEPLIATEDIITYKRMQYVGKRYCTSLIRDYIYLFKSIQPKVEIHSRRVKYDKSINKIYIHIEQAYHSYTSVYFQNHQKNFSHIFESCYAKDFVKCIIPKGSEYYISECGDEIASSCIIVERPIRKKSTLFGLITLGWE